MYNSDTEVMFPPRVISQLRNLRGVDWQQLVDRVCSAEADLIERAAFTLMMVRMGGCQSCTIDSYRGMRGCTMCARQTIRRFRGPDHDLVKQFEHCKGEVQQFINKT
jgi:type II secretory ATPase GspE/PulE/Tfp pilus assembly ATPase PilB-like protein